VASPLRCRHNLEKTENNTFLFERKGKVSYQKMKLFFYLSLLSNLLGVEAAILKGVRSRVLEDGLQDPYVTLGPDGNLTDDFRKKYYDDDDIEDSEDVEMHKTIEVTNLAFGQPLGRFFVMSHSDKVPPLFELGNPATNALALLAETGDPQYVVHSYTGRPGVLYVGIHDFGAPYEGGESTHITLPVTEVHNYITIAAMAVNTNDCFVAANGVQLDVGDSAFLGLGYDAGSEENNEMCSSVPGPACLNSGNEDSGNGEGFVHVHRGISGCGDLRAEAYKWLNPMIRVEAVSVTVHESTNESPSGSSNSEVCPNDVYAAVAPHMKYVESVHFSNTDATCGNRTLMENMSPFIEHVRDIAVSRYGKEHNVKREDVDECELVKLFMSRNASLAPDEMAEVSMRNEIADTFLCITSAITIFEQMIWIGVDILASPPESVKDAISATLPDLLKRTPNAIADVVDTWKAPCDGKSEVDCNAGKAWTTFTDFCKLFGVTAIIGMIDENLSWWDKVGIVVDVTATIAAAILTAGLAEVAKILLLIDDLVDLVVDVIDMIDACSPPIPCAIPNYILGQEYSASNIFSYTIKNLGETGSTFYQTGTDTDDLVGTFDYCSGPTVYYNNGYTCGGSIGDRQGAFTANEVTDSSRVGTTVEEVTECRYKMSYKYIV